METSSEMSGTLPDSVVLVHLSDIHFCKPVNGAFSYTPDDDIRNELKRDLHTLFDKQNLPHAHFVLVTGDIAFSGGREEYEKANNWLKDICQIVRCPEEFVRTIPGNHDVQRSVIDKSPVIQDAHDRLRQAPLGRIDHLISQYHGDKGVSDLLFQSLKHYNEFANRYGCSVNSNQPFWDQDVTMNDRSTLRIRGLNSTLVSDAKDNENEFKLVVGSNTCVLKKEEGVEYLVLCHHPPLWLREGSDVQNKLDTRARLSLFGHQHVQQVLKTTSQAGHEALRLHAGAVNPEQGASDYRPRYNVLQLSIVRESGQRKMKVAVHRRQWDAGEQMFAGVSDAGGGPVQVLELKLPDWEPSPTPLSGQTKLPTTIQETLQSVTDPLNVMPQSNSTWMNASRRLAYRFLALPYHYRIEIAQHLSLLRDEDESVFDPELARRFFQRAKEAEKMAELWRLVEQKHGAPTTDNPFLNA